MKTAITAAILAIATTMLIPGAALAADAEMTAAKLEVVEGEMLHASNGRKVAAVYEIGEEGEVRVIFARKLMTVPADTLFREDEKLMTSLSKRDIILANR